MSNGGLFDPVLPDGQSEEELDELLDDAIYAFDAELLNNLLRRYSVDPNRRIDGVPMLHLALDAETERGIGEPGYRPTGRCLEVLIDAGADPFVSYLDETVDEWMTASPAVAEVQCVIERALSRRDGRPD
jgi:hypothetical protein